MTFKQWKDENGFLIVDNGKALCAPTEVAKIMDQSSFDKAADKVLTERKDLLKRLS